MIEIQLSNRDAKRGDTTYDSSAWKTIAGGNDFREALCSLVWAINAENISVNDEWLRIINTETKMVIF